MLIRDVLNFAPRDQHVVPIDYSTVPPESKRNVHEPVPYARSINTWAFNGLLPHSALICDTMPPQVLCPSPFVLSGIGIRSFSTKEMSQVKDLPVIFENRLTNCLGPHTTLESPLLKIIPLKILTHGLWLSRILILNPPTGTQSQSPQVTESVNERVLQSQGSDNIGGGLFSSIDSTLIIPQEDFDENLNDRNETQAVATKADNAEVQVQFWNQRLLSKLEFLSEVEEEKISNALSTLCTFALRVWRRRILLSFIEYCRIYHIMHWSAYVHKGARILYTGLLRDIEAGRDCLYYVSKATCWEWKGGSRTLFWRWPFAFRAHVRDCLPIFWNTRKRPDSKKLQSEITDSETKIIMKQKIESVREKKYIQKGHVKSLISYFSVPKGDNDVRMVYDGTASGFNSHIWVPSFGLPTISTLRLHQHGW